jgi:UPF0042 nucleotide-binding protein
VPESAKRLVIVSGLSGSGKTIALHALEDLDFYAVDNLPVSFLKRFARMVTESDLPLYRAVAVGIDARNPAQALSEVPRVLEEIAATPLRSEVLFMEAADDVLIKRFSETRRKHPLSTGTVALADAITRERELLGAIAEHADLRIDTTHTQVHELRELIRRRVVQRTPGRLSLQFVSFGYKHGVPAESDFVFDARCLPNPHWQPNLRPHSGRHPAVAEYLGASPLVGRMVEQICDFLEHWIPHFEADNRSYLTVAVGCTGGRHRSVYLVDRIAKFFQSREQSVLVRHRDLREPAA